MSDADDSSPEDASVADRGDYGDVMGGLRRLPGDDGDRAGDSETAPQPTVENALAPINSTLAVPSNHNTNVNINNPAECPLNIADTIHNKIDKVNIVHKHRVNNYKTVNKNTIYNTYNVRSSTCSTAGETEGLTSCDETEERVNVSREPEFLAVLNALDTKGRVILSSPPGPKRESYVSALRQHFRTIDYTVSFYTSVKDCGKKRSRNDNNKQVVLFDCAFGVARLDMEQYHSFYNYTMYRFKSGSTKIVFLVYPHVMSELEECDRVSHRPLLKTVHVVTLLQHPPLSFKHYHGLFLRMLRDTSHGEAIGSLFALAIMNRIRPQTQNIDDVRCLREFGFREFSPASLREYATLLTGFLFEENQNFFTDRVLYEAACISLSSTYLRNEHLVCIADMEFLVQYVRTTDTAENMNNKPMVTLQPRDNRVFMGRLFECLTVTGPLFEALQHPCLYDQQFLQQFEGFCNEDAVQNVFDPLQDVFNPFHRPVVLESRWLLDLLGVIDKFGLSLFYWSVFGPTSRLCDWFLTIMTRLQSNYLCDYADIFSTAFAFALRGIASPVFMQKEIEFWKRLKGLTMQRSHAARIALLKVPTFYTDFVLTENLRCVFHNIMETAQKPFHYMNLRIPDTLLHASVDDNVVSIHLPCQQPYLVLRLLTDTDVDEQDEDGNTVLHLAADLGQLDAIKLAVNSGASIAVKNKDGLTSPQLAATRRARDGDNVQYERKAWLDVYKACKSGDTNKVKTLLCHNMGVGYRDKKNGTPLHYASSCGQTEVVSLLADLEADVNATDHLNQTPLILACNRTHLETAKLLISRGADVNIPPMKGFSPLYVACMNGQRELVEFLLQHNADVSLRCDNGRTPLAVACKKGHWDVAELLLRYHADINVSLSEDCVFTLLHKACCEGQYQLAEFVLQHEADPNLETSQGLKYRPLRYDVTPTQRRSFEPNSALPNSTSQPNIYRLSLYDVSPTQKRLSQTNSSPPKSTTLPNSFQQTSSQPNSFQPNSAQPNSTTQPNTTPSNSAPTKPTTLPNSFQPISVSTPNQTSPEPRYKDAPIHLACYKGHANIVLLLVSHGANVNAQREDGATALHVACQTGDTDVVRALISCNADLNSKNSSGESPLLTACLAGKTEVVRLLLHQRDVQLHVNNPGQFGLSPLHCACISGDKDIVEVLVEKGANVNSICTLGMTPLHWICVKDQHGVAEILLGKGADLSVVDNSGQTPLHLACENGYTELVKLLLRRKGLLNVFNIDILDSKNETALAKACLNGHTDIAEVLLKRNADLNLADSSGQTLLHKVCERGFSDMVRLLLKKGADINARDKQNQTPLFLACKRGHIDSVRLLLKHKADVLIKDAAGQTELAIAQKESRNLVVNMLHDHMLGLIVMEDEEEEKEKDVEEEWIEREEDELEKNGDVEDEEILRGDIEWRDFEETEESEGLLLA